MYKHLIRIFILLLLFFDQGASAQNIPRLRHYNVEDGLSQSSVYFIFQDRCHFLWLATGDGLDRYDGRDFFHFKSTYNDTSFANLKYRTINSRIFEDAQSNLWMSGDAGLCYMDYRHKSSGVIKKDQRPLYASPVAIDSAVLWAVEPGKGIYSIYANNKQYGYRPGTDSSYTPWTVQSAANTYKHLWIVDDKGVFLFDKFGHTGKRVLPNSKLNEGILLKNGNILLTTTDGCYLLDTATAATEFIRINTNTSAQSVVWRSCVEDTGAHNVYLGSLNNGLLCRLNTTNKKYEVLDLHTGNINCLFIDQSQNLWIGTEGNGVYKLDIKPPKFFSYAPPQSDNTETDFMVKSIYHDALGRTWMGTYNHGLSIYDHNTDATIKVSLPCPEKAKTVSTVFRDSSGKILAAIDNRIFWLDEGSAKIKMDVSLPVIAASSPLPPVIFSVLEQRKGVFLVATNIGLFCVNATGNKLTSIAPRNFRNNKAISLWIYGLYAGTHGEVYLARRNGFCKIKMTNDTTLQLLYADLEDAGIRHFYKSNAGILWIATEKGLVAYNESDHHYKVFDEGAGLANSFIYSIQPQNDSSLWISTNHGLSCVTIRYGADTNITARFTNYTSRDGLQSNEFNTGAHYKRSDGTMFFGGIAGINWFNPSQVKANPFKPAPSVAAVLVNDQPYAADTAHLVRTITLPWNSNTISFSLRAMEFTQPEKNSFAYKLEGQDKDWVHTSGDKVRYSNLGSGCYTFLVKAANNDGTWNEEPLKIGVVIFPPYWQTWWFLSLVALSIITIVFAAVRLYIRQKVRTRTRGLEKQQALYMERLRISKDVHDDLGSGLSKISLMAELAQKKVTEPAIGKDIQHISSVSKELVDNMRDLIWVLNPDNTTLEQLVTRLREYCSDYLEHLPLTVTLDFPASVPEMRISREAQRNIFLTTKEAINNCVKHASACAINISLSVAHQQLHISISDNGKGFDISSLKGAGNGLRNMQQRIEHTGGAFSIDSSVGGTTVSLSVPFVQLCAEKIPL